MHHPRIDDYTLAEPFWWVGNWDASACEASCEDGGPAQQVGEPGLCLGLEGQLRAWVEGQLLGHRVSGGSEHN